MPRSALRPLVLLTLLLGTAACGGEETDGSSTPGTTSNPGVIRGSRAITQGGPQDIALFRSIVDAGGVPSLETLDPVGFFAEHALDLPPADCGQDVCLHPMLAVAPRFDGGNWTMAFVAMNSPVDPATLPRPPLHLVLALERTATLEPSWRALEAGLRSLASRLRDEDRLSLVLFSETARVHREGFLRTEIDEVLLSVRELPYGDGAALYDGVASAGRTAGGLEGFSGASRILLVTSGRATAGIRDAGRIVGAAEAFAREGIAIGVVGAGAAYDPAIPRALGELGVGTVAYAQSPADLDRILRFEGDTTLFPIATGFTMEIEAAPGYRVGQVFGARRATTQSSHAQLESPALFLGHREGASDVGGGRRGGGGGLFVQLVADPEAGIRIGGGAPAFTLRARWTASDGREVSVERTVENALAPGQNPADMWPSFSAGAEGKAFMMLNMYLALRATVELYEDGDCGHALGVFELMAPAVEGWQARYDDLDIADDFDLLGQLRDNAQRTCDTTRAEPTVIVEPVFIDSGCMFL